MKICAFIMALLVLGLSFLPCADEAFATMEGKAKTEILQHSQGGESAHNDACSPFCHCTCCAGFSYINPVTEVAAISLNHDTRHHDYCIVAIIEISLPIWQPPQLAA